MEKKCLVVIIKEKRQNEKRIEDRRMLENQETFINVYFLQINKQAILITSRDNQIFI